MEGFRSLPLRSAVFGLLKRGGKGDVGANVASGKMSGKVGRKGV